MSEPDTPDDVIRVRCRGLTILRVPRSRVDFAKAPDPTRAELRLFRPDAAHDPDPADEEHMAT